MSGADVTFQVVGSKKEEKKVKNVLNKWVDRGFVGNITVAENDNSIKTPLAIQSVDINQPGVIRENDEFILSCVARGSPSMTFRWFKDGTFVNLTFTPHKWIKLIKHPHVTDQYTALLAVGTARKYDEGKFTCQVEDFNIQQCKSKFVKVKRPPLVKIEPMSLTVRKGQNFTVNCVTLEGNWGIIGKYTYSWTKNKELLPVRTDSERYETLYPAGTILQVFGIEKDVHFSCLVQDSLTSSERSIQVHFLDKQVHPCSNETKYGLIWPETAPDTEYVQECPKDYSGIISRKCMLRDGKTPAWGAPDFSQCTGEFLRKVYEQFEVLKYGYGSASIESLFSGFLHYTSSVQLRPGEGTRILVMLNEILAFLNQTKLGKHTIQNLTQTAVSVLDSISSSPDALLRAKDINLLQTVLFHQLEISGFYLVEQDSSKALNLSLDTLDITVVRETPTLTMLYVPAGSKTLRSQSWVSTRLTAQLKSIYSDLFVGIVYRNLSLFFPPKLFLRNRDENEIQYQIFSQVVTFVPISSNLSKNENVSIKVDFLHKFSTDFFNATSKERWEVRCGYADMRSFAYDWDIYTCTVKSIDEQSSTCICSKFGSYVLILVLAQTFEETPSNVSHKYVLISSFFLGIILTISTTICLGISCFLTKNPCLIYLKLQCTVSLFFCEVLFAVAIIIEPPQASWK
uniref:Ig-like domain-containing protein n=1 Tax=Dendroctonus ponderosae TaxID=77166 RepID=A0AAR5P0P9_DENPD